MQDGVSGRTESGYRALCRSRNGIEERSRIYRLPPYGLRFTDRVSKVTRMNAAEQVSERVLNVEIELTKCSIDNEWMEPVCPG